MKGDLPNIINNFNNNKHNNNIKPVVLLLKNHFDMLIESLLYKELTELLQLNNNKTEYEKKENDIIEYLKNNKHNETKEVLEKLILINPNEIDKDKNSENIYKLIDLELLKLINKSKKFLSKIETCYYFINQNIKYIFFS